LTADSNTARPAQAHSAAVIGVLLQSALGTLPREALDWPLALLSMDWQVQVFLSGPVLAQLPRRGSSTGTAPVASHANWSRLWLAATELGAEWYTSTADASRWGVSQSELALPLSILTPAQLRAQQATCRHLLSV